MPCYASTENCSPLLLLIDIAKEGAKCLVVALIKRKILRCRKALYEGLNGVNQLATHGEKSEKYNCDRQNEKKLTDCRQRKY